MEKKLNDLIKEAKELSAQLTAVNVQIAEKFEEIAENLNSANYTARAAHNSAPVQSALTPDLFTCCENLRETGEILGVVYSEKEGEIFDPWIDEYRRDLYAMEKANEREKSEHENQ